MIALLVATAAIANFTLVAFLAERFGSEGGVHTSAGELTSLQAPSRPSASIASIANENAFAARAERAA
ncbi:MULTISPECIES: hypothetical protein [unclassified Methylobacterium]|uniref:hypothetical protein n=1 Tax=unclassified Methylobacterium TaxID=2615210 RepID=UPI0036FB324D